MKSKIVVEQKPLMNILSSMQPICAKRTALDATSYILFQVGHKELVLKSTDLEISLQASYLFSSGDIQETHSFLVSGKRIFELIKELEGDITLTATSSQLKINAGGADLSLKIKDMQDFPVFPERIENLIQLEAGFFLQMLARVAFLIPQNNANAALNGLYLEFSEEKMKMTTTDGHCLAQVSTKKYILKEEKKWLLPRRAIFEVKKILDGISADSAVFLGTCGNQLVFSGDSFNFFTKLLVDPFPQYEGILNKEGFLPAQVSRLHLMKTLRRSSCFLSGQFIATQFGFRKEAVSVTMDNKDVGNLKEDVPLEQFAGKNLDIRFYAPYLLNGLQAFSEEKVSFLLKNEQKPIIFESGDEDKNVCYLVMPVSATTKN